MSLKIYGFQMSRTYRTLWMAEEIKDAKGIEYEHDGRVFAEGEEREFLLAKNPMGQVPVIDDDGFILCESMAINLYLARKYDVLAPSTLEEEAVCWRWSFWAMTAVEADLLGNIKSGLGALGAEKDEEKAAAHVEALQKPLGVLNESLADTPYLLGDSFSVGDLNVASVLMWSQAGNVPLASYPALTDWLTRCLGRAAAQRAAA